MFPKCSTMKVPPVTQVHNKKKKSTKEQPTVVIEFGDSLSDDDNNYPSHLPHLPNMPTGLLQKPTKPPLPPTDPADMPCLETPPSPSTPTTPRTPGSPRGLRRGRGTGITGWIPRQPQWQPGPPSGQAGLSGTQGGDTEDVVPGAPRWSMRERFTAQREDNIYPPGTTIDKDLRKKFGKHKKDVLLGSVPEMPTDDSSDTVTQFPQYNVNSTTEGGVQWINKLFSKAISAHDSLPDPANVRDWTAKDLPANQQKEW